MSTVNVLERDIQLATEFYILTGMDELNARIEADSYMKKREALYQEAIKNGYNVSDQEVYSFLDELKDIIDSAENKDDAYAIMSAFESEDAYWDYQFYVYQKNLPIQNYVKDLEKSFYQTQNNINSITAQEQTWEEYFEQYKQNLFETQNFRIIE